LSQVVVEQVAHKVEHQAVLVVLVDFVQQLLQQVVGEL
jgi:hypothetical protein